MDLPEFAAQAIDLKIMPQLLPINSESNASPHAMQVEQQFTPDKTNSSLPPSRPTNGPEVDGATETLSSVGEATDGDSTTREVVQQQDDLEISPPPSFLYDYWYIIVLAVLAIWGFLRLLARRGPNFEHQPIDEEKKALLENPRGQFKPAERFMRPANKEGSTKEVTAEIEDAIGARDDPSEGTAGERRPADPEIAESNLPNHQQADTMQQDQPSDDEFDFDLNEGGSDSDVFSAKDATEISGSKGDYKKNGSSKRFKTEADVEASGVKHDELEFDDEFDDQDSQLSLADSDAEFGFDLDDDESNKFLDSGNLASGSDPSAPLVADDADSDFGIDEIEDDATKIGLDEVSVARVDDDVATIDDEAVLESDLAAGVGLAASPVKKAGFFARMFGGKNKKTDLEAQESDSEVFAETDSTDPMEAVAFDDANDSFALDEGEVAEGSLAESLDSDDDFDFDLESEESESEPSSVDDVVEPGLSSSESVDSDEFEFDLEDSAEDLMAGSDIDTIEDATANSLKEQAMIEPDDEPVEQMPITPKADESSEFGFGIFEDNAEKSIAANVESSDADAGTNFTTSAVAATAALGAGIAGIASSGAGKDDEADLDSASESNQHLQTKLTKLETRNQDLTSQVAALKQQIDDDDKQKSQSDTLKSQLDKSQKECEALSKTVDSLTSEKDELAKEKDELAKANEEITKENGELVKEKDEILKQKDSIDSENKRLAEELSSLQEQSSEWEQEKAVLLERQNQLEAEKTAVDSKLESATSENETSVGDLASLKAENAAFADERTAFEAEIKDLQTKLSTLDAKPAATKDDSGEDIEDLRNRFKLRLAAEHRKRKEAQQQVDQAEAQRNEVAQQLRAAKAELVTLRSQQDDDDFELVD